METIVQNTAKRTRQRSKPASREHIALDPDLLLKLYELLEGDREMVRLYSRALDGEICFVNPALKDPDQLDLDCPVYTTRELAYIISLSEEDFRRFHYLKTRLVG